MKLIKEKVILFVGILTALILLTFMMSGLRPYLALFLAITLIIIMALEYKYRRVRYLKVLFVIFLLLSILYIILPIKIIFNQSQPELLKVSPILYGLPTAEGWQRINSGDYFPGGDVVSLLDPKYAITIKK